ncbi:MAG: B12-binding domain-containing radical SAM protein [Spirochaetes bacterium]|nr:B12-binding domain-containing radical SAM protein [Spirochaetota bacterium]
MKVLLISPPRSPENKIYDYAPEDAKKFIHRKLIGPPLGIMYLAEVIKHDHDVTVYDMKGQYDLDQNAPELPILTEQLMKKYTPDIVGVTFLASEFNLGMKIFEVAKKMDPDVLTVAGGIHATLCPEDFVAPYLDIICYGESVDKFKSIVEARKKNKNLKDIPGIILVSHKGLEYTKKIPSTWSTFFSKKMLPDRTLIETWYPTYRVPVHPIPATYVLSSLGCPYQCSFCSIWPQINGCYYQRDIESIITEIKSCDDYLVIRFADANTIVNPDIIDKLFDRIIEEEIHKHYVMDIRVDTAVNNPDLIKKLADNGLKAVICGLESFREKELKNYNKNSGVNLIPEAIKIFHDNGIHLRGNYVIPPDYDEDDFDQFTEFASKYKVALAGYTILTPMPGSIFYNQVKNQIVDHDHAKYNFFNSVLKTKLPLEKYYEKIGALWKIKLGGTETIDISDVKD